MLTSAPDDYGLTADETLAMRLDVPAPEAFTEYWSRFRDELTAVRPHFNAVPDGPVSPVVFRSLRDVRIAGRLTMPEGRPPVAVVVTSHGYAADGDWAPESDDWVERGLAVLRIRVRGFPPSTIDVADLRSQWILHRLADPEQWILRGATADLIQAVRCVHELFPATPIHLQGESFGGGLAVIAAAQLAPMGIDLARLSIGLPSLGGWTWRRGRYCNGSGAEVAMMLDAMRKEAGRMERSLALFDAVLHASTVTEPTLAKLAERDDVVPAPTAAAIVNALATPWRRIIPVPFGHFDGGLGNARRHVEHARLEAEFLDPNTSLEELR